MRWAGKRTTNGRCTALATLTHRSPHSHFDRRVPSIEFNIQRRAARALHLTALGEQKIIPLPLHQRAGLPFIPTGIQQLRSTTLNVRNWTVGDYGFDPVFTNL
ncbi:hypothetical protein GIW25_24780 [Pseudomonas syringae]|nr:hypothetical protein [Pseudomonas syringae]